jgi:hypothetical protein
MKVKLIKSGSIITLYNGIYAVVYGLLLIIFHKIVLSEYFRKIPLNWEIFAENFPKRASLHVSFLLIQAFLLISFGIFIAYLSYFILKRKDKLAWVILFLGGIISWAGLFIVNVLTGSWIIMVFSFIGWASFVIGMTIPIKYYIQKGIQLPKF